MVTAPKGERMDTLKTWFVEVACKNVAPKVTTALLSAVVTFLIAHQEFMEQMGITFYPSFDGTWHGAAPTGQLIVVELDTLGKWGAAMLIVGITALWAILQHHTVATVTGTSQIGDKREAIDQPLAGGNRPNDPPKS